MGLKLDNVFEEILGANPFRGNTSERLSTSDYCKHGL